MKAFLEQVKFNKIKLLSHWGQVGSSSIGTRRGNYGYFLTLTNLHFYWNLQRNTWHILKLKANQLAVRIEPKWSAKGDDATQPTA